jgi:antitoxin FitA
MAQVLIRDVEAAVMGRLKERARKQGRSLEAELRLILEQAAAVDLEDARRLATRIRRLLAGRTHSDSAALVAEDRRR